MPGRCAALVPLAVAFVVLAGCLGGEEGDSPASGEDGVVLLEEPYSVRGAASTHQGCVFCYIGTYHGRFLEPWETLEGFSLRMDPREDGIPPSIEDTPVVWRISCYVEVGGRRCEEPILAEARGDFPMELERHNVSTPPGAVLVNEVYHDNRTSPLGLYGRPYNLTGTWSIWRDLSEIPSYRVERVNVSYDGHTGPCVEATDPLCDSISAGTVFRAEGLAGRVVHVNLTVTWTPETPYSESLWFRARCQPHDDDFGRCPGARDVVVRSHSPLRVDVRDPGHRPGDALSMYLEDGGLDGAPFILSSTRQPYHVEGYYEVKVLVGEAALE